MLNSELAQKYFDTVKLQYGPILTLRGHRRSKVKVDLEVLGMGSLWLYLAPFGLSA